MSWTYRAQPIRLGLVVFLLRDRGSKRVERIALPVAPAALAIRKQRVAVAVEEGLFAARVHAVAAVLARPRQIVFYPVGARAARLAEAGRVEGGAHDDALRMVDGE